MRLRRLISTVDTHTAGGPTRTVTGGLPSLRGATVSERMAYFATHHDDIRLFLTREPRGHADMYGAIFTEPATAESDAGLFFMTPGGYLQACVHSTIGAVAAALHTGSLRVPAEGSAIAVDVPAGTVRVRPVHEAGEVTSLAVSTPPAWLWRSSTIDAGTGPNVPVEVVFSGAFFLIVEGRAVDARLAEADASGDGAARLRTLALQLLAAADSVIRPEHPTRGPLPIGYVMLYERTGELAARSFVVSRAGAVDRTPCGAGTAALAAASFVRGELRAGERLRNESMIGTRFDVRIIEPAEVAGQPGAVPEVEGSAYITGMHTFVLDERDPLPHGFQIQEKLA